MPNPPFLKPTSISNAKIVEIGDYGTVTELTISGTTPEVLCSEDETIRFATLAVEDADVYVLVDNNTNVSASPTNYNYKWSDGDTWTDYRLGKQRYTICTDNGLNAVVRAAIAHQEIIII